MRFHSHSSIISFRCVHDIAWRVKLSLLRLHWRRGVELVRRWRCLRHCRIKSRHSIRRIDGNCIPCFSKQMNKETNKAEKKKTEDSYSGRTGGRLEGAGAVAAGTYATATGWTGWPRGETGGRGEGAPAIFTAPGLLFAARTAAWWRRASESRLHFTQQQMIITNKTRPPTTPMIMYTYLRKDKKPNKSTGIQKQFFTLEGHLKELQQDFRFH